MSFIPLRERNVTASLSSIVQTLQHNPEEKKYMDWQRIASQQNYASVGTTLSLQKSLKKLQNLQRIDCISQ